MRRCVSALSDLNPSTEVIGPARQELRAGFTLGHMAMLDHHSQSSPARISHFALDEPIIAKLILCQFDFGLLPDLPALNELRTVPHWVAWRYRVRDGKKTKPPVNPHTGHMASVADPTTWGTFADAAKRVFDDTLPGVGFVLTEEDNLTGYDLDKCVDEETGEIEPWAQDVIDLSETYAEISPSGRGIRLWARGKIEASAKSDRARVEMYRAGRYLTITGRHIETTPDEISAAPRTLAALQARLAQFMPQEEPRQKLTELRRSESGSAFERSGGDFFRNVNDAAFANLDPWVPVIFPMARRQASTQGYRITSKQLGRNLQEDLSITPMGAEDFGLEEKRTAIDLVVEYKFAKNVTEAGLWLCERLNLSPESLGYHGDRKELGASVTKTIERTSNGETTGREFGPLPLRPDVEPSSPFPVAALGRILAPAAEAIATKVQVPAAMAGQSVLAAAALAAQAHADVLMPYGQKRPLSLFMATVAASGDRKSATDNEATRPVVQRESQLGAEHKEAHAQWRVKAAAWSAEKRKIENNAKIGLEERQNMLMGIGPEPVEPIKPLILMADITSDGLTKNMMSLQGSLGLFTPEGSMFTGGHAMTEDNRRRTAALLSEAWDGSPIKRVRAGDGVSILNGRRLAIHIMIQPGGAADFLGSEALLDQGLLSRFLVASPESLAGTRFHRDVPPELDATIQHYCTHLLRLLKAKPPLLAPEFIANELDPRALPIGEEACSVWIEFHDHIEGSVGAEGPLALIRGFAAKAAENAARIAGVLTIVADIDALEIGGEAMRNATALMDWYVQELLRLKGAAPVDARIETALNLLKWLKKEGGDVGFSRILTHGPHGLRSKHKAEEALVVLVEHGWVEEISTRPRRLRLTAGAQ